MNYLGFISQDTSVRLGKSATNCKFKNQFGADGKG